MRIHGTVLSLSHATARIRIDRRSLSCDGSECSGCSRCHTTPIPEDITIRTCPDWVQLGMTVTLELTAPNPAISAMMVFGLPLLCLGLGVFVVRIAGGESPLSLIGGALGGLAISALLLMIIERTLHAFGMGIRLIEPTKGSDIVS